MTRSVAMKMKKSQRQHRHPTNYFISVVSCCSLKTTFFVLFAFLTFSSDPSLNHNRISWLIEARRVRGTFDTNDFFVFIAKFGFPKTGTYNHNSTQGFIFGNITTSTVAFKDGLLLPNVGSSSSASPNSKIKREALYLTTENSKNLLTSSTNSNVTKESLQAFKEVWSAVNNNESDESVRSNKSPKVSFLTTPSPKQSSTVSSSNTLSTTKTVISKISSPTALPSATSASPSSSSFSPSKSSPNKSRLKKYYPATLVVIDRSYFVNFYRPRLIEDKDEACAQMFSSININIYYDAKWAKCVPYHMENFLRRIPCNKDGYCVDEKNVSTIVHGHQFTYSVGVKNEPKFMYVSLVACYLDQSTCQWKHSANANLQIDYDIWLVNGNPYQKKENPLQYQFSFDKQDTAEIYLVFFICYLILVPLQIHAVIRQRHIVPRLFTAALTLEFGAVLTNVVHILSFSNNGEGYPKLAVFGDILDILARAIFMLILLVLAKGWAVTRVELRSKPLIFSIWIMYGVIHILLYVWNQTEVDVIEDIEEYQTWPGWLILVLRTLIMMWFVYELKDTMDHEHQPHKLNFFLHFGAAALVWFIYLPIVALIALQVSPLWRSKLLLGITYSADCLAFATMTHLLWPTRSQQYFLLTSNVDTSMNDELEEFNEAPHVVNPYASRSNNRLHYSVHDISFPESVSLTHTKKPKILQSNTLHNHNNSNGNGSASHFQRNGNGTETINSNNLGNGTYVDDKDSSILISP